VRIGLSEIRNAMVDERMRQIGYKCAREPGRELRNERCDRK
jgi:hypothetical protein